MDQAVKRMRGEPSTKVMLTLFRKSENRTFPVTIVREEIRVQSVRAKVVEPGYAWLRVSQFQDRTVDDFARKLDELFKQDPAIKGLVLDLRNDPGGLLEGAVAVSAAFLPSDAIVVTTNGQIADSKATFKATPSDYLRRGGSDPLRRLPDAVKKVPLVVLVNEGSASASEIVAGALQDHKRATLVGTRSFGKGSVQTIIPLGSGNGALRLTTARYFTPSGKSIQAKGIVPDIEVLQDVPDELKSRTDTKGEASLRGHLKSEGDEKTGSQSYVPPDAKNDKALKMAADLLHGVKVNASAPPGDKAAIDKPASKIAN
jgi:carboxyl-terminal processing protease